MARTSKSTTVRNMSSLGVPHGETVNPGSSIFRAFLSESMTSLCSFVFIRSSSVTIELPSSINASSRYRLWRQIRVDTPPRHRWGVAGGPSQRSNRWRLSIDHIMPYTATPQQQIPPGRFQYCQQIQSSNAAMRRRYQPMKIHGDMSGNKAENIAFPAFPTSHVRISSQHHLRAMIKPCQFTEKYQTSLSSI